jgi:hypothetical protein
MTLPAYPAFESPWTPGIKYWTGTGGASPIDIAALRTAIRAIIRIGPSATAAGSDMLNMYPNNNETISMNDRWVRALAGPYYSATSSQTYGQSTSIDFNTINTVTSMYSPPWSISAVVNLFIKGYFWYQSDGGTMACMSKHFPMIDCFFYSRGGYLLRHDDPLWNGTWNYDLPNGGNNVCTSTSTDGWSFTNNNSATIWRTVKCPWSTEVNALGSWTMQSRQSSLCGVGNATYAYVCGGMNAAYTAYVSTTNRFTYATAVNTTGPALAQASALSCPIGNSTYAMICGGQNYAATLSYSTSRKITYSTNAAVTVNNLSSTRYFWGNVGASTSSSGYASGGLDDGVYYWTQGISPMDVIDFTTGTRSTGTALSGANGTDGGDQFYCQGNWSQRGYWSSRGSTIKIRKAYIFSTNSTYTASKLGDGALDLVRTPNSVDSRYAAQADIAVSNNVENQHCNSPAF